MSIHLSKMRAGRSLPSRETWISVDWQKRTILTLLLMTGFAQPVLAMKKAKYEEILEAPIQKLNPARVRKEFLAFMCEHTQLPKRQTNGDRYQAILQIIHGGSESKEKIQNWRKANIDFLEHIHVHYSDDFAFAPIINALEGQLKMLDLDEQLIDNPQDIELWNHMEALCDELIASNSHFTEVTTPLVTLKMAIANARPKIVGGRIMAEEVRAVHSHRLLQEEEEWARAIAEAEESDKEDNDELDGSPAYGGSDMDEDSD